VKVGPFGGSSFTKVSFFDQNIMIPDFSEPSAQKNPLSGVKIGPFGGSSFTKVRFFCSK
jgi:hypothetical protein